MRRLIGSLGLSLLMVAGPAFGDTELDETEAEYAADQVEESTSEGTGSEEQQRTEAVAEPSPVTKKTPEELKAEQAEKIWLADSAIVYELIAPLRQYRENEADSSVQQKARKRKLANALRKVNDQHGGKELVLESVVVEDVTEEKEITNYGLKRIKQLRKQIEQDPSGKLLLDASGDDWTENPLLRMTIGFYLAGCDKCFRETGRYTATFKIKGPREYMQSGIKDLGSRGEMQPEYSGEDAVIPVEIVRTVGTEREALKFTKGRKMPVKGKIIAIDYEGSRYRESVKLYIK